VLTHNCRPDISPVVMQKRIRLYFYSCHTALHNILDYARLFYIPSNKLLRNRKKIIQERMVDNGGNRSKPVIKNISR
jgi:hypothetical protein